MPNFADGSYSCAPCDALIAKVLAGKCTMKYTRAAVGSGTIPEGESPQTITAPPGYVMDAMILGATNPINGQSQITVQINSEDVEEDFYATGILLYAEDPDLGEVPYTYLFMENEPDPIRSAGSSIGKLSEFDLIAKVGAVDRVYAVLDPDAFVKYEAMSQLVDNMKSEVDDTIDKLNKMVEDGDFNGEKGNRGDTGPKGEDGVSPIISTTPIDGGHRITFTDASGSKSIDVMNGKDYELTKEDIDEIATIVAPIVATAKGVSYDDSGIKVKADNVQDALDIIFGYVHVISTRTRNPNKPSYGLSDENTTVALDVAPYTGTTEIGVVVSGTEYDANNLSATGETAESGTLIIKKMEE